MLSLSVFQCSTGY